MSRQKLNGKKRSMLLNHNGSVQDFINELCAEVEKLAKHLFVAKWQYKQFTQLKKQVPRNWLVMVADFAENYRCIHQDEIQSAYYQYQQVTIHPIVGYYRCDKCEGVVSESAVFISGDLDHDAHAHAVEHFTRKYEEYLKEKGMDIEKELLFSDGCSKQYKSKLPFYFMSEHGSNFERGFFGSRYGKGPCDGVGGVIKKSAETFVKGRQGTIRTPKEFYQYCQENLQVGNCSNTEDCIHKKRVFFYAEHIERPEPKSLKTLAGTRSIHSARGSPEPGHVKVHELSCYCHHCQENHYDACANKHLVGEWKDFCLLPEDKPEGIDRKRTRTNGKQGKSKMTKTPKRQTKKGKTTEKKVHSKNKREAKGKGKAQEGLALKKIKQELENELCESLPETTEDYSFVSINKVIDRDSVELVPNDIPIKSNGQLFPAEIYGDGNCLPRCGSFLVYGNESHHSEIRKCDV